MISIVEQIFLYGKKYPDKCALSNGKSSLSYKELMESIVAAKSILEKEYGVKRNDRVIIAADKQLEFVSVYFACHLLGIVTLPIAPDTNENRYRLIKAKVKPALVIGFKDEDGLVIEVKDLAGKSNGAEGIMSVSFPDMNNVADIIFTTGTTGEPKGVQLSQKNLAAAALNINTFIGNTSDDVELLALPISHSFGLGRMRCALSNGQTLVMLGSFANVKRFFRFIDEYHVTGFGMVPASWALIKKLSGMEIGNYKNQLHYIEIGSAPMPMKEKRVLIETLPNTRICMHYGLTEASRSAFMEFHEDENRLSTVGRQSPNMYISIKDENGQDVRLGEDGEICVKGDAVTVGYLDFLKEESFYGDYFRTGDWGRIDKEGYITLKSRKKELINVGGKKVSPVEVEEVLMAFDFVKDCACVAAEDPEGVLGEVVKAFIVTDQAEKVSFDYMDPLIGSRLEGYKHPLQYVVVEEIPKTSSGKVQRLLLK